MINSDNKTISSEGNYLSLVKRIKYFQALSEKIIAKKPLDELLDEIISASKRLIGAESSSLLLFDQETDYLHFHIATGEKGKSIESKFIKNGEGIAGWVAANKKAIRIDDCYSDKRFSQNSTSKVVTKHGICYVHQ
jgi:sigma-B regulation protein RsbU (phosphoserine phosphatase)